MGSDLLINKTSLDHSPLFIRSMMMDHVHPNALGRVMMADLLAVHLMDAYRSLGPSTPRENSRNRNRSERRSIRTSANIIHGHSSSLLPTADKRVGVGAIGRQRRRIMALGKEKAGLPLKGGLPRRIDKLSSEVGGRGTDRRAKGGGTIGGHRFDNKEEPGAARSLPPRLGSGLVKMAAAAAAAGAPPCSKKSQTGSLSSKGSQRSLRETLSTNANAGTTGGAGALSFPAGPLDPLWWLSPPPPRLLPSKPFIHGGRDVYSMRCYGEVQLIIGSSRRARETGGSGERGLSCMCGVLRPETYQICLKQQ